MGVYTFFSLVLGVFLDWKMRSQIGSTSKWPANIEQLMHLQTFWRILMLTCNIWLASKAVPGRRTTGLETCPDSTQIIFGYSSSPKSGTSLLWSSHGFHTTGIHGKFQSTKLAYNLASRFQFRVRTLWRAFNFLQKPFIDNTN